MKPLQRKWLNQAAPIHSPFHWRQARAIGQLKQIMKTLHLTGNAIGIKEIDTLISTNKIMTWVWVILILVLLAVAFRYYMKVRRKSYFGKISNTYFKPTKDTKYLSYDVIEKTKETPKTLENRDLDLTNPIAKENSK